MLVGGEEEDITKDVSNIILEQDSINSNDRNGDMNDMEDDSLALDEESIINNGNYYQYLY